MLHVRIFVYCLDVSNFIRWREITAFKVSLKSFNHHQGLRRFQVIAFFLPANKSPHSPGVMLRSRN